MESIKTIQQSFTN